MQYLFKLFILSLLFFFGISSGKAQEKKSFLLDSLEERQAIYTSYFQIYIDKKGLTFEELLSQKNTIQWIDSLSFIQEKDKVKTQDKATVWGKVSLKNPYPIPMLWVVVTGGNYVEAYYSTQKGEWVEKILGFTRRHSKINTKDKHRSYFYITTPANAEVELYVHYSKDGYLPLDMPFLRISNDNSWQKFLKNYYIRHFSIQAFFQGVLLVMMLYNLLIYVLNRDSAYLDYAFYLFFIAIYTLNSQIILLRTVLREVPYLFIYFDIIPPALANIFYMLFARSFLDTKKLIPKYDKLISLNIYILIFNIILQASIIFFTQRTDWYLISLRFVMAFYVIISVVLVWKIWLTKSKVAYFFIAGSFLLLLSLVIYGLIPYTPYDLGFNRGYIIQVGIIIEILIFSLGLGFRIRSSKEEQMKAQDALIEQLQKNEELQVQVNRELENKVQERTAKLQEANQELNATLEIVQLQNEQIEQKNKDITDSINYAQRIQKAMLPTPNEIKKEIEECFIFFQPREIVSGDFYWFAKVENYLVMAALDCTGHGVPGAFMSMVGNDLLNDIVVKNQTILPNQILEELHKGVQNALRQRDTGNQDGMDAAIVSIDKKNQKIYFSGAKNPLIYIENQEIKEIKADRLSIGGVYTQKKKPIQFTLHQLDTKNIKALYLFSDGYQDQFGGKFRKKIMLRNLKEYFLEIHRLPIAKQKELLKQKLDNWIKEGKETQVDDILVIGMKISNK